MIVAGITVHDGGFGHLRDFIREREDARMRKEAGIVPSSTHPVISKWRFCNCRREDDKLTKWYVKTIAERPEQHTIDDAAFMAKVRDTIIFRLFNTPVIFDVIGDEREDYTRIDELVDAHKARDGPPFFTSVYITTGFVTMANKRFSHKNSETNVVALANEAARRLQGEWFSSVTSQREAYEMLEELQGLGPFIAYQIVMDLMHIPNVRLKNDTSFVVAGPGARAGLKHLFPDGNTMGSEESIRWLVRNQDELRIASWQLTLSDMEHVLCELDKYVRALNGANLKRRYRET